MKYCPQCKTDLTGPAIPDEYKDMYNPDSTHYQRQIGIYDMEKDMTMSYRCPDCQYNWCRFCEEPVEAHARTCVR